MSASAGFPLYKPMTYEQYIESPQWRATRAAALLRAGNRCALDATHTGDLSVLHNTRERLGAELDSDLIVLCASCAGLVRGAIPCHSGAGDDIPYAVPLRRVLVNSATPADGPANPSVAVAAEAAQPEAPAAGTPPWAHLRARRHRRADHSPLSA